MKDVTRVTALLAPADSGARRPRLVGLDRGRAIGLDLGFGQVVSVGRDGACTLQLEADSVSRRHAEVVWEGDGVLVRDCDSRNGTFVNGMRMAPGARATLGAGDVLRLGDVSVVVQYTDEPVAPASTDARSSASAKRLEFGPLSASDPANLGAIAHDPTMRELYALLATLAPTPLPILVLGETGVGKEVYAEAAHNLSARKGGPFVKLNCASLPESILEAELFGYEKGAFTGAAGAKPGLFESADGGTVFLDELGEMPLSTQAKLLRVLENGEVQRLGALRPKRIDVRVVAATNRDLELEVHERRFRADLFFRLSGYAVTLPPLRQRIADIVPLAEHFLAKLAERMARPAVRLSDDARAALEAYPWPGNVRELRNAVERAAAIAKGPTLGAGDLQLRAPRFTARPGSNATGGLGNMGASAAATSDDPLATAVLPPTRSASEGKHLRAEVDALERQRILEALERSGGNQSRAAKELGIARNTLIKRLDDFGIPRPRKSGTE